MRRRSTPPLLPTYRFVLAGLVLAGWLFAPPPGYAQPDPSCDTAASTAENLFYRARFAEAADLVEGCLEHHSYSEAERLTLFALLGRIHYSDRNEDAARDAVRRMLEIDVNYVPESDYRPSYVALIEEERQTLLAAQAAAAAPVLTIEAPEEEGRQPDPVPPSEPSLRQKRQVPTWLLIGGGAVLTGAAIALIAGGDTPSNGFPGFADPPGTPEN